MATAWARCIRRMRFQHPSNNVFRRNRSLLYALLIFPLCLLVLLIPGGEITNFKYLEADSSSNLFVSTFPASSSSPTMRRGDDGSDGVVREARSVGEDASKDKLILLYNAFFGSGSWGVKDNAFENCQVSKCQLTLDRGRLGEADAVLFNARGLPEPEQLPQHPPWQVWMIHNSEPPYNLYLDLSRYNNIFNWTSWYRRDADIFSPYGGFAHKASSVGGNIGSTDVANKSENSTQEGITTMDKQEDSDSDSDVYNLHDKVIFFAASNCQDRGRRYKKVAQLRRYLPIDEYGDCGRMKCLKGSAVCEKEFERYQFVLAFENGYCRDYITEKLWNAYRRLQIPIVSGGADYEKLAIPGSYIDYDNFTNPEELARFVHRVSTSPSLYNSFFEWRQRFDVIQTPVADWCGICEALNDQGRPPQVYKNLKGWVAQDSCPLYSKYQYFWTQIYLGIFKLFGV